MKNSLEYKRYLVTIVVIIGYHDKQNYHPKLRQDEYTVVALNESDAKDKAKKLDKTKFSVYETYASEY